MPLIVLITPFVEISRLPGKKSNSIFFVILIAALIHVSVLIIDSLFPLSFAVFETNFKLACIDAVVFPFVLSLTFRFSIHIYAGKNIAICK